MSDHPTAPAGRTEDDMETQVGGGHWGRLSRATLYGRCVRCGTALTRGEWRALMARPADDEWCRRCIRADQEAANVTR